MKWIETMRSSVRPVMLVLLALLIGPLAIATGFLEAFWPGVGLRFSAGFTDYMQGLPAEFWAFAGTSYGIYTAARSFGNDKKVDVVKYSGTGNIDNPDDEGAKQ